MDARPADDAGQLILRLALGILMLLHGVAKLTGGVGGIEGMLGAAGLPPLLAYGAYVGEVVAPLMVIAGFYARVGAALIAVNMLFAVGLAHADEILALSAHGGWQLELQGLYLLSAVALALTGPGRIAVNQR